ncbi:DUF2513 domain-containing protein [Roseinatronobacter monicus]|uniref:Uncharacterized protein DUF2513 n=1 Tax=Roseinatronobacter monicus TaxID=393481 RepID=A0A543KBG0_9RHOB|nr:DUF2513 domain-containing protein [Roseinatronobacter monicus]TQM92382.1 uncharacterized protein DUF2513 [Roseinatronobacter monicus]
MTRDDDFIREMLFEAEQLQEPYLVMPICLSPSEEELKRYMHGKWLSDAGLFLEVNDGVFRITNQGHDYLAAIRSDTVWDKTKDSAQKAGGVTLGLMKEIAVGYARQELTKLGIPLG